ncbi:TPA: 50S ribosomal protein L15e [Candidatus Bathyarchaeota archaeon]|nr:50S ribosomal protein L15e [Candidatus Bathyarchaeota archaeon]
MMPGAYAHLSQLWRDAGKNPALKEALRQRLIRWRRGPAIARVERPTKLPRARALGWKAKQGYVVVRVRVPRGGFKRRRPRGGRRQKRMGVKKVTGAKSIRQIAEERAARKFPNLEVLNSYEVAADGRYRWFEVILVDPHHPAILKDPEINWIYGKSRGKT